MAATALRVGEAAALRWSDIDFGERRVRVQRRWYRGTFAPPKSRYGTRTVPISTRLAQRLWQRRPVDDDALVFGSATGTPLDQANAARRVLKPAARRAGVEASWHTLRHSGVTAWFRAGANAAQVQRMAGHHSAAFTLSTYVHLLDNDLPDADALEVGNTWATRPAETGRDAEAAEAAETAV